MAFTFKLQFTLALIFVTKMIGILQLVISNISVSLQNLTFEFPDEIRTPRSESQKPHNELNTQVLHNVILTGHSRKSYSQTVILSRLSVCSRKTRGVAIFLDDACPSLRLALPRAYCYLVLILLSLPPRVYSPFIVSFWPLRASTSASIISLQQCWRHWRWRTRYCCCFR